MFSSKTKLTLLFGLLIVVVLVTWIYAQQSYSAFNVNVPEGDGIDNTTILTTPTAKIEPSLTPTPTVRYFPTATESSLSETNCTYPLAYWQQNQDQIPPQILVNVSTNGEKVLCVNYAQSEICSSLEDTSTDTEVILSQQFLVVIMNYLSGADPGVIANTISDAYEWLRLHTSNASISVEDVQAAQDYTDILQSFNQGDIGPGACDIEIIPLTQANTPSPSPTVGITAAEATSVPTITSTPTVRRTVVIVLPTATKEPEDEPEPTNTPIPPTVPPPTATSPPPPPPPTATQAPPPTSTEPPTPTPVPEIDTPTPVP